MFHLITAAATVALILALSILAGLNISWWWVAAPWLGAAAIAALVALASVLMGLIFSTHIKDEE